jgi:hypothetical protein
MDWDGGIKRLCKCYGQRRRKQHFQNWEGPETGGSFVPLLFNLVGDVLTKMIRRASERGHIRGILENFVPGGIMALQYADDTLMFSA